MGSDKRRRTPSRSPPPRNGRDNYAAQEDTRGDRSGRSERDGRSRDAERDRTNAREDREYGRGREYDRSTENTNERDRGRDHDRGAGTERDRNRAGGAHASTRHIEDEDDRAGPRRPYDAHLDRERHRRQRDREPDWDEERRGDGLGGDRGSKRDRRGGEDEEERRGPPPPPQPPLPPPAQRGEGGRGGGRERGGGEGGGFGAPGGGGGRGGGGGGRDAEAARYMSREEREAKDREAEEAARPKAPKEEPNMGLSGQLAKAANTLAGTGKELKHVPPPEARLPDKRWRLYIFKNDQLQDEPYRIHRMDHYLFGRDVKIVDICTAHPSCSKQHAVLQFRLTPKEDDSGRTTSAVRPYLLDLGSVNGTFLNGERLESLRYYELLEKDVVRFGQSSREYVLLHDKSGDE